MCNITYIFSLFSRRNYQKEKTNNKMYPIKYSNKVIDDFESNFNVEIEGKTYSV
ncbi:hypothetical protein [Tepidibacter aestuarii]|uniref:hypothetical protein n=1 Tax=Tepidibacter aestuarii TaxID=2925782 RepID=UPI0020C0AFF1|nr:hypothetical protein [Tepidibacter aestuarii]CAH2213443.1 protein of unknown function [Tepidibacter aestuarii]